MEQDSIQSIGEICRRRIKGNDTVESVQKNKKIVQILSHMTK